MFELKGYTQKFAQAIEHLKKDLAGLRTGRATPALVENLKVEQYGALVELRAAAAISAPEPRLLVIQPWDPQMLQVIERAIAASQLSLNPVNDGHVLRLPIPQLTTERRQELAKLVSEKGEHARIVVRSIREEAVKLIRREEKDSNRSKDETERDLEQLQDEVEKANALIQAVCQNKSTEIETT